MNRFIAAASSFSLAIAGLGLSVALPTVAQAEPASGLVKLCQAAIDAGYDISVSECARYPGAICEQAKDLGLFPLDVGGGVILRNKGDCVNYVKAWFNY